MRLARKQASWVSIVIGSLGVSLLLWFAPAPLKSVHAIFLPATSQSAKALPQSTRIMQWVHKPQYLQPVGYLHLERPYYPGKHEEAQLAHAQIEAALQKYLPPQGANAFFVEDFHVSRIVRGKYIYIFKAIAYCVPTSLQVHW